MIDYNTYHKMIKNKDGKDVKLVLNHIDNKDCKAYLCRAVRDYTNNCDDIKKNHHYVCLFAPMKTSTVSHMNWNKCGYFGMGAIEHTYESNHNDFSQVIIFNSGKVMKNKQTKYCRVPIECIEIIDECDYIF